MPISTRELSKVAGVSEQTVRNYTRDYGELLSPAARGETGPRSFSDEDVQIFCTIATLRKDGVPPSEVIERVTAGDIYIEATPKPQQATTPHKTAQEGHSDDLSLPVALSSMDARLQAVERRQDALLRAAMLWGALVGVIVGLALAAAFMWGLYLFA